MKSMLILALITVPVFYWKRRVWSVQKTKKLKFSE